MKNKTAETLEAVHTHTHTHTHTYTLLTKERRYAYYLSISPFYIPLVKEVTI